MKVSEEKKDKLQAIIDVFCQYAFLAANWDPIDEEDFDDLVQSIKEILDE